MSRSDKLVLGALFITWASVILSFLPVVSIISWVLVLTCLVIVSFMLVRRQLKRGEKS